MDDFDLRRAADYLHEGWDSRALARAVKDGALAHVRHGVYEPVKPGRAHTPTAVHRRAVLAATLVRHEDSVVSHVSAAVLHRLPVRRAALGLVHLSRGGRGHGKVVAGVHLHRTELAASEVVEVDGLRVTSLERTVADLARTEPYAWGVCAADAALRSGASDLMLLDLAARGRRTPGNKRFRDVLAFADAKAESPLESLSRVSIARAGLPTPVLQHQVRSAHGMVVATSDFGWPELRTVGEADGRLKYADDPVRGRTAGDAIVAEKARDQAIRDCGVWVVHWGWADALDHQRLGKRLVAAFRAARPVTGPLVSRDPPRSPNVLAPPTNPSAQARFGSEVGVRETRLSPATGPRVPWRPGCCGRP